jgi:hypothetical protein
MSKPPVSLNSASALTPAEREERQAFEQRMRALSEAERRDSAARDLAVWRGVAEQLLKMVESDLLHERRVRSARISEHIAAVMEALRANSADALVDAVDALSSEVWGDEPDPDDPMNPALAQRRRAR